MNTFNKGLVTATILSGIFVPKWCPAATATAMPATDYSLCKAYENASTSNPAESWGRDFDIDSESHLKMLTQDALPIRPVGKQKNDLPHHYEVAATGLGGRTEVTN